MGDSKLHSASLENDIALTERLIEEELIPRLSALFDESLLEYYERDSLQKRLEKTRLYLLNLFEAFRSISWPKQLQPPAGEDVPSRENIFGALLEEIRSDSRPELKRGVLQRMLSKMGRHYLWTNLSSLPLFHEISALLPWWCVNNIPVPVFRQLADHLSRELLNGIVMSLQRVREEIINAEEVYLGHCVCRSSGIANDLYQNGRIFTLLDEEENRLLLDRLLDRYENLDSERLSRTTDVKYRELFGRLSELRRNNSPEYRMENFLQWTYPDWEILPIRPGFTARWIRSMQNNNKCHRIDRDLVFEMLNIFYFSRGAIFNSMKCVDTPYTICTCPSPENEGGCVLTNWYYYARMNYSLIPEREHYGCRTDANDKTLPCCYFPVRAKRDCIGCGCNHQLPEPRDLHASLAEADLLLGAVKK